MNRNINFRPAEPKSENQSKYITSIKKNPITICTGNAGSGKTFLALSCALEYITQYKERYKKIIIIRPFMQSNTGEKLGSLPGTLDEKVGPYVEGIIDNLKQLKIDIREIYALINSDQFEFSVLSMCRGRSFANCIVLVEEAQNVPKNGQAMKMLLSRIGKSCKMIISGDTDQLDIPEENSALLDATQRLAGLRGVGIVKLDDPEDIQRNPLIQEILHRYS